MNMHYLMRVKKSKQLVIILVRKGAQISRSFLTSLILDVQSHMLKSLLRAGRFFEAISAEFYR